MFKYLGASAHPPTFSYYMLSSCRYHWCLMFCCVVRVRCVRVCGWVALHAVLVLMPSPSQSLQSREEFHIICSSCTHHVFKGFLHTPSSTRWFRERRSISIQYIHEARALVRFLYVYISVGAIITHVKLCIHILYMELPHLCPSATSIHIWSMPAQHLIYVPNIPKPLAVEPSTNIEITRGECWV